MSSNIVNQIPYLRTTRDFPEEMHQLTVELTKSYIDTANAVNNRIISIFPTNRPAITGESWFLVNNQRQQSLRQVYTFTAVGSIAHGINWPSVSQISAKSAGSFTDGTNWYGIIYASDVPIAGQLTFYVTPTNIVVLSGGGGVPAITNGTIVLEWLSNP